MSKDTTVKVTRILQDAIQDDPMAAGIKLGINGFYHEVWEGDKLYCFSSPVEFTPEVLDAIDAYLEDRDDYEDAEGILLSWESGILTAPMLVLQLVDYDELKLPQ